MKTIKKNSDFIRVYKNGKYFAGNILSLHALKCDPGDGAIGVTVGKKAGKSVRRNRLKRLIKENYRQMEANADRGFLFVFAVRARRETELPDYYEIRREMRHLLSRAGALQQQKWENSQSGV